MTIDIATARLHVKSDGDDDVLLQRYLDAATPICEGYCNRKFYADQGALDADFTVALTDLGAAQTERNTALDAATSDDALQMITNRYTEKLGAIKQRINGVVIDPAIDAAVLLTVGHLYFNRQDVVVGNYSSVTQVPVGAQRILEPYLWIGDLAGVVDTGLCVTTGS